MKEKNSQNHFPPHIRFEILPDQVQNWKKMQVKPKSGFSDHQDFIACENLEDHLDNDRLYYLEMMLLD